MINIILVEDCRILIGGVKSLLEKEPGFKIVGEAVSGAEVLKILSPGIKADIIWPILPHATRLVFL